MAAPESLPNPAKLMAYNESSPAPYTRPREHVYVPKPNTKPEPRPFHCGRGRPRPDSSFPVLDKSHCAASHSGNGVSGFRLAVLGVNGAGGASGGLEYNTMSGSLLNGLRREVTSSARRGRRQT